MPQFNYHKSYARSVHDKNGTMDHVINAARLEASNFLPPNTPYLLLIPVPTPDNRIVVCWRYEPEYLTMQWSLQKKFVPHVPSGTFRCRLRTKADPRN